MNAEIYNGGFVLLYIRKSNEIGLIFIGRQCRYVIQSMQYITKTVCHAGKERLMLKIRLMGTKNSIKWFRKVLQKNPKLEVKEFSGLFPNKGANKFYWAYVEVEKNNIRGKQQKEKRNYHV